MKIPPLFSARASLAAAPVLLLACSSSSGGAGGRDGGSIPDVEIGTDVAQHPTDARADRQTTLEGGKADSAAADARVEAASGAMDAGMDALQGTAPDGGVDGGVDAGPLPLLGATMLAASATTSQNCALLPMGEAACWGGNSNGELGLGTSTGPDTCGSQACSKVAVKVPGLTGATSIAVGYDQTYAVLADATVTGWGAVSGASSPTVVAGLSGVKSIVAGQGEFYAVLTDGTLVSWAANAGSAAPAPVAGVVSATGVAAGNDFMCVLLSSGAVECEGANDSGQLGDGTAQASETFVTVEGLADAVAITAGDEFACALQSAGSVVCWGDGSDGQLGGTEGPDNCEPGCLDNCPSCAMTPVAVPGAQATSVSAGSAGACAVESGMVECWGELTFNSLGAFGTLWTESGLTNPASVAEGVFDACAIVAGGRVYCWGSNLEGYLGDGTLTDSSSPVAVVE